LEKQGPDAYDGGLSAEAFTAQLKPYNGEIKSILNRGKFVNGIGNTYVDEVLFAAKIAPFKRRTDLSAEAIERLTLSSQRSWMRRLAACRSA
jgi:formamidopyrimidine-DNA glycosylase